MQKNIYFIPSPVTFSPTKLNFVPEVPGHRESFLMRLGELLPGSRVGYWGGRHCRRAKIFTCPSRESNPGRWIYRQTLYHVAVKAGFYTDVVECLPVDPAAQVRFPPRAVGIFLHPVTFGGQCGGECHGARYKIQ